MDILEELPVEQWPQLQEKLKASWPLNMPGYYTLHVNYKYPKIREAFMFKVYCPHGNMDNGFVAINEKVSQDVIIFSITEDMSKIEEAVLKTKLIDWNKVVFFKLVTLLTLQTLERVRAVMQFKRFHVEMAKCYHLEGTTKPATDLRLPTGTYLSSVKPEYIQQVNDKFPYKHAHSHTYFTVLASNGFSYGLYSSDTDELLAWVFMNENNYLSHFFCEEQHRRRGYGEYVAQCAVNDQLKDGYDVFAHVVVTNVKPLAILTKLGFKPAEDAAYVFAGKPVIKC